MMLQTFVSSLKNHRAAELVNKCKRNHKSASLFQAWKDSFDEIDEKSVKKALPIEVITLIVTVN
jgi:hypothetical protein